MKSMRSMRSIGSSSSRKKEKRNRTSSKVHERSTAMITTEDKTRTAEEDGMGFHPGFPSGFDPKRAEKGLAQDDKADEAWKIPPTINQGLHAALHHVEGAAERWRRLQEKGATDDELKAMIGREFGLGG